MRVITRLPKEALTKSLLSLIPLCVFARGVQREQYKSACARAHIIGKLLNTND